MIETFCFDRILAKKRLSPEILKNKKSYFWIDIISPSKDELKQIQQTFNIHHLVIEDCLSIGTRPKIEEFDNYTFIILYELEYKERIKTNQINFIVGKNYLITIHKTRIEAFEALKNQKERLAQLLKKGPGSILHTLIGIEVDNYFPALDIIETELDRLENRIIKSPNPTMLNNLFFLKRELLFVRKKVYPQREILANLSIAPYPFIKPETRVYFRDIYDHIYVITDLIENYRDITSTILEVHMFATSNKLNEIVKVLTIIATIIMPLTLIASVYGMNFQFMPELTWRYGYFTVLGIMLLISVGMLTFFKYKKWI